MLVCFCSGELGCIPSAQTSVVVDDLYALDVTEARENALQLVGSDLIVEVANVQRAIGLVVPALAGLPRR